jgi:hypothetical protein
MGVSGPAADADVDAASAGAGGCCCCWRHTNIV